jgi:hypothetical protein
MQTGDSVRALAERDRVQRPRFLLVPLALARLAGSAPAQSTDRPSVRVGDQWSFVVYYGTPSTQPNRTWVITAVTPTGIEGTENGEPLMLTPDLNVLESPRHTDSHPKALSFPLEVGKRWQYTSSWVFKPKGSRVLVCPRRAGHREVGIPQPVPRGIHGRAGRVPVAALTVVRPERPAAGLSRSGT